MATRVANRLSVLTVKALTARGLHADGNGLYLQIAKGGSKTWAYRFSFSGKVQTMGLGPVGDVTLAQARELARIARDQVRDGKNPIMEKKIVATGGSAPAPIIPAFGAFAADMIAEWSAGWKNPKHAAQWLSTITAYTRSIKTIPVDRVDTDHILAILKPHWRKTPETARRVRGRIERILDAARARKLRSGDNPARWGGHLKLLLADVGQAAKRHHPALAYGEAPAFMTRLRALEPQRLDGHNGVGAKTVMASRSMSSLALEFLILTASRTGEVIMARKPEVNFDAAVWTIPASRMKEKREHRVPLTPRAVAILREVWPATRHDKAYIFKGGSSDGHLSNMAMTMCLRGLVGGSVTVHGFRSTFSDWVGDETDFAREIREAALSHKVGDDSERAYRRGDALARRRALMQAWEDYLGNLPIA